MLLAWGTNGELTQVQDTPRGYIGREQRAILHTMYSYHPSLGHNPGRYVMEKIELIRVNRESSESMKRLSARQNADDVLLAIESDLRKHGCVQAAEFVREIWLLG